MHSVLGVEFHLCEQCLDLAAVVPEPPSIPHIFFYMFAYLHFARVQCRSPVPLFSGVYSPAVLCRA